MEFMLYSFLCSYVLRPQGLPNQNHTGDFSDWIIEAAPFAASAYKNQRIGVIFIALFCTVILSQIQKRKEYGKV